jgi:hypothetical protein
MRLMFVPLPAPTDDLSASLRCRKGLERLLRYIYAERIEWVFDFLWKRNRTPFAVSSGCLKDTECVTKHCLADTCCPQECEFLCMGTVCLSDGGSD